MCSPSKIVLSRQRIIQRVGNGSDTEKESGQYVGVVATETECSSPLQRPPYPPPYSRSPPPSQPPATPVAHRRILEEMRQEMERLRARGQRSSLAPVALPASAHRPAPAPAPAASVAAAAAAAAASAHLAQVEGGCPAAAAAAAAAAPGAVGTRPRWALYEAQRQSLGCFVAQNSSFGNLILPVLPRLEDDSTNTNKNTSTNTTAM